MEGENIIMKEVKRGFGYYCKIYRIIVMQDIKCKMSYRADFIVSILGMLFSNIAGFIAFWILFRNFPSIVGWNYYEMLFLYGFSLLSLTPTQCFFDNNWRLRNYVFSGEFIKYLFRPINVFFYYQAEVFDVKGIGQFFFGIGTLVYAWAKLQISFHISNIVLLILALISASLFMIAIMNIAAAFNFWLMGSTYIMLFASKFKEYAKYPVTIFNTILRLVFTFMIPIAFVAYYPSLFFLRPNEIPILTYLSPVFGVGFFVLSYKIWMRGALSYSGTGS